MYLSTQYLRTYEVSYVKCVSLKSCCLYEKLPAGFTHKLTGKVFYLSVKSKFVKLGMIQQIKHESLVKARSAITVIDSFGISVTMRK